MADPRSPLADIPLAALQTNWSEAIGVTVNVTLKRCMFQVQAWPDTIETVAQSLSSALGIDVAFNQRTVLANDDVEVVTVGPGRVLVSGGDNAAFAAVGEAVAPDIGAVTDLSHARIRLDLTGSDSAFILSKGLNLDFDHERMPDGTVHASGIHGVPIIMVRRTRELFTLYVPRTFAAAIAEWIGEAAQDVGVAFRN